jgi:hypothetical protein
LNEGSLPGTALASDIRLWAFGIRLSPFRIVSVTLASQN